MKFKRGHDEREIISWRTLTNANNCKSQNQRKVKGNLQCIRNVDLLVSELAMGLAANSRDVPGDPEGVVQTSVRVQAFRGVL